MTGRSGDVIVELKKRWFSRSSPIGGSSLAILLGGD
jgi:hypothetical protein